VAGSRSFIRKFIVIAGVAALLAVSYPIWLGWVGAFLVKSETPFRADMIVVLAGDGMGHRILKGGELVEQGYAPNVLVSGPPGFYGRSEDSLAIPFAVEHGYPLKYFIGFPNDSRSTVEEAKAILPELQKRGVKKFILVTSDYHTGRAGRIYHPRANGLEMRVVAAPDEYFTARGWWHTREGRKTVFLEWSKTFANLFGI
jgi:uncharacterized SAM-binding protein YcdF (DUF218 family)